MDEIKVIGGEFLIPLDLTLEESVDGAEMKISGENYYTSGRTCLYAILKNITTLEEKRGGVLIPNYICTSIARTIGAAGFHVSFYEVGRNFYPDIESLYDGLSKEKIVLLVNYFGMIRLEDIVSAIRKKTEEATIIIDDVQNYYGLGKAVDFDYAFTSFRKWFPVPDGAEIVVKNQQCRNTLSVFKKENEFARYKFAGNILKNFRKKTGDPICLELLEKGEEELDKGYLCKCTEYSLMMLQRIDKEAYAEKRRTNARVLHEGLKRLGIANVYRDDVVPFFIPIIIDDRTKIREKLFEQNIFCPVHWPYESEELQGKNSLYTTELSLICDQRYDKDDMKRILEILEHEYKVK